MPARSACGSYRAGRPCGRGGPTFLLDPATDLFDRLQAEPDDVERVQHGDRVVEFVMDGVVESDRGAVSSVSAGPFPRPAPRTGRATSTASGSPRGAASVSRRVRLSPPWVHGRGDGRAAVAVPGYRHVRVSNSAVPSSWGHQPPRWRRICFQLERWYLRRSHPMTRRQV